MAENEYTLKQTASDVQQAIDNALNPDTTLTQSGKLADAKAVGDALATTVKSVNGVEPDENGNVAIEAGGGGNSPVQYIESLDESNLANLRDLESGSYVLYGYFRPYAGASSILPFDNLLVNVFHVDEGSHLFEFSTANSEVNFIEILVDSTVDSGFTYSRTPIKMLELHALIEKVGDLSGLTTTEKGNLVAAINEVAANGSDSSQNANQIEPTVGDIPRFFLGAPLQQTKDEIVCTFSYTSKTARYDGYAEIKAQGNSSMRWPKKNQTVKLYKDADCTEKLKIDFNGWGEQSKFCLKANWIDLAQYRNVVSARLWADMVKTRANYAELPELYRTSPNQGAVDGFPVLVYADGVYQGRFTLNIPKDKWMANMDDELDTHCILCGENYKSGCFRATAKIDESDWTDEIHDTVPDTILTRWNEVITFVQTSTDEEFRANLGNYFDVPSLIDYDLFGIASIGLDAYGKNQLYFTYDGLKWIAGMYDMDCTWRMWWTGSFVSVEYSRYEYQDYLDGEGNLLYMRLEELFHTEMQERWAELRAGALRYDHIMSRFEQFNDICPSWLIAEDYASTTAEGAFTAIPLKDTNNIQQLRADVKARLTWADTFIAGLTNIPATSITLSASELTFDSTEPQTLTATVEPTDTTDVVVWESSDTTIATVENGVVTPVTSGNVTITATAGDVSAECAVTIAFAEISCTGITLDNATLTFDGRGTQTLTATVTPEDTTDSVIWGSDDEAVATVSGGVVTAIGNGSATITATCGDYSATCTVSVSGVVEIPYDVNVLTDLSWDDGYYYKDATGVKTAAEGNSCTDTFQLYDCLYELSVPAATDNANKLFMLYVWDGDGNYITNFGLNQKNAMVARFVAKPEYQYALRTNYLDAKSAVTLTPVDRSANAVPQFSIPLADLTWSQASNGKVEALNLDDVFAEYGVTPTNYTDVVNAANMMLWAFQGANTAASTGIPVDIQIRAYLGNLMLATTVKYTLADWQTYLAENNPVLTIN